MAAWLFTKLMWDTGVAETSAEFALAGKHLSLLHSVEPVDRIRTGAGDREYPLVPIALDPLDRIVGTDPGLVPRDAVDGCTAQFDGRRTQVCPMDDQVSSRRRLAGPEWLLTEAKWP